MLTKDLSTPADDDDDDDEDGVSQEQLKACELDHL